MTKYREDRCMTMKELGEELDISESYISLIEGGKRIPSVRVAKKIGELLEKDWTLFYEDA
ncbi:MAG: helix-turn-helix transcriptional regulator [Christensenellaceae bacterium]